MSGIDHDCRPLQQLAVLLADGQVDAAIEAGLMEAPPGRSAPNAPAPAGRSRPHSNACARPGPHANVTAQQILSPLLNLFPSLKNFVVPNHNATCPKWSVHLFDRDVPLQDHCPMLEQVLPTAYATMAAVWILIALFIVLAA